MKLCKMIVSKSDKLDPFHAYILSDSNVKRMYKEFDFYNIKFYKEEFSKSSVLWFQYPKGNMYWYLDFIKYIKKEFLDKEDCMYVKQWNMFLDELLSEIRTEASELKDNLNKISASKVLNLQLKYQLRDYQAFDLAQFLVKYSHWDNRGLILSEPRTGKTRVALAAAYETLNAGDVAIVICPKTAAIGWYSEIEKLNTDTYTTFNAEVVNNLKILKSLHTYVDFLNIRIISYDLFKKLTLTQIRQLTSKCKNITLICDEVHRLRNFKTLQSKAIFDFKEFCNKDGVELGIIGLTGTPAVKETTDVFGTLSLINESKIRLKPYYDSFNCFKEYFYYCEDTSFGKVAKALRREHELNYIIQTCSVQTMQKELAFFKDYKKVYKKVELDLDAEQKIIYNAVYNDMEYDEDIDCQNKLVQLIRLQQICIDPFGLITSYERLSPKLKWVLKFALKNKDFKFIVACKKTTPLKHLMKVLEKHGIQYSAILGEYNFKTRLDNVNNFTNNKDVSLMLLQLDTGREALTLPAAKAIVFLDRDFAQGFNEQAEARMTPVDGSACTKFVIDLVMKGTKEEQIYETLVIKKKSIDAMNTVFKSRKLEIEGGK